MLYHLGRSNAEDGKGCGDVFEFCERRIFVHGHVRPRSRRALQVSLQDDCTLAGGTLFELDLLTTAAPKNCSSSGCPYVLDPAHLVSEHGHQVALSLDNGDDHGQRQGAPRLSSGDFQSREIVGGDARREYGSGRAIQYSREPVGSLPTVQPSSEIASSRSSLRIFHLFMLESSS